MLPAPRARVGVGPPLFCSGPRLIAVKLASQWSPVVGAMVGLPTAVPSSPMMLYPRLLNAPSRFGSSVPLLSATMVLRRFVVPGERRPPVRFETLLEFPAIVQLVMLTIPPSFKTAA